MIAEYYNKPILSDIPITWGLGFHRNISHEKNIICDDLYLIHLAYVSIEESARRNSFWKSYSATEGDIQTVYQAHRSASIPEVTAYFRKLITKQLIAAPEWLRGQF